MADQGENDSTGKTRQKNIDFYFRKSIPTPATPNPATLSEPPSPIITSHTHTEVPFTAANANTEVLGSSSSPFEIWTEEMWKNKKEAYPWLDAKDGKLGCKVCSCISDLSVFKAQGSWMGDEWRTYRITHSGTDKSTMLTSLRKKILRHLQSNGHIAAQRIQDNAK